MPDSTPVSTPAPAADPSGMDLHKVPFLGGLLGGVQDKIKDGVDTLNFLNDNPRIAKLVMAHPELRGIADKDMPMGKKIGLIVEGIGYFLQDIFKGLMDSLSGAWDSLSQQLSDPKKTAAVAAQAPAKETSPVVVNTPSIPQHVIKQGKDAAANVTVVSGGSSVAPGAKPQMAQGLGS